MNWLKTLFAENPWPLIWMLAIAALALIIATIATGRAKFLFGIWGLALVAITLVIVEWLWETDRERVDRIIDSLAHAVRMEDSAEIARHLAPHVHYGALNREAIERLADSVFRTYDIDRLTVSGRKTVVSTVRKLATAEFLAVVRGRQSNLEFNPYPTRWVLTFDQNETGDWQIVDVQQIAAFGEGREPIGPPGHTSLP